MTNLLLDSDVIIELLKGNNKIKELIKQLFKEGSSAFYTPISLVEIYAGLRTGEEKYIEETFGLMEFLTFNEEIGKKAGSYLRKYMKSHNLQLGDALIAATAFYYKYQFYTLNKKHYPMDDIKFFDPEYKM